MAVEEKYNNLIVRHLDGSLEDAELKELLQWLKSDEAHTRYYLEIKDIWHTATMTDECGDMAEEALDQFVKKYSEDKVIPAKSARLTRILLQAAATLLLACLLTLGWNWITRTRHEIPLTGNEFAEVFIPNGHRGQVTLSDGTRVWLNSNSTFRYPSGFGAGSRKVILDGEAYLEVAKDPDRPFLLETSGLTLRVLGTSFNVKCYSTDNTIETTLISGSLEILAGKRGVLKPRKVVLKPNETAIFMKPNNEFSIAELDRPERKEAKLNKRIEKSSISITQLESIISWKDNHLIFKDESFEDMAKKMEAWYGVQIRIEDEKLKHYRFTGKFVYNETIDQVLEVISRTTPLEYKLEKNVLIVRSR